MHVISTTRRRFAAVVVVLIAVALASVAITEANRHESTAPALSELAKVPFLGTITKALDQGSADAAIRDVAIRSLVQNSSFTCGEARSSIYGVWSDSGVINTACYALVVTPPYVGGWIVISSTTHRRYYAYKWRSAGYATEMSY